jgi:hypothetical protein
LERTYPSDNPVPYDITGPDNIFFAADMWRYCGRVYEINKVEEVWEQGLYGLAGISGYNWTNWMLEPACITPRNVKEVL